MHPLLLPLVKGENSSGIILPFTRGGARRAEGWVEVVKKEIIFIKTKKPKI